jgi:hypothetical protein
VRHRALEFEQQPVRCGSAGTVRGNGAGLGANRERPRRGDLGREVAAGVDGIIEDGELRFGRNPLPCVAAGQHRRRSDQVTAEPEGVERPGAPLEHDRLFPEALAAAQRVEASIHLVLELEIAIRRRAAHGGLAAHERVAADDVTGAARVPEDGRRERRPDVGVAAIVRGREVPGRRQRRRVAAGEIERPVVQRLERRVRRKAAAAATVPFDREDPGGQGR